MSGSSVLVDANAVIAFFGGNTDLTRLFQRRKPLMSSIVYGELYFGALKSVRVRENLDKIEAFLAECDVLDVNLQTARRFGEIRNSLRRKGRPIPTNDLWIAASAFEHGVPLVSNDAHFDVVDEIQVLRW